MALLKDLCVSACSKLFSQDKCAPAGRSYQIMRVNGWQGFVAFCRSLQFFKVLMFTTLAELHALFEMHDVVAGEAAQRPCARFKWSPSHGQRL